ncbi:glycosyltransferase [Synechococcus sp. Cu2B8-bc1011]|uniref:glycosyltransferase n=1 Tax=Synechococcus sp. Cu2B8-bc1011 TaxID=3093725 RepID=UPI0039AFBBE8
MKQNFILCIEIIDNPDWIGGTIYLANLVRCLFRLPEHQRPDIRILGSNKLAAQLRNNYHQRSVKHHFRACFRALLSKLRIKLASRSNHPLILYPGFSDIPSSTKLAWIPDLQHCVLPELFSSSELLNRNSSILSLSDPSQYILFSSESSRRDFHHYFPDHQAVTRVCHFHTLLDQSSFDCHNSSFLHDLLIPPKFLYLPNQFWSHKNHITVLKALLYLKQNHNLHIPLVLTGQPNDSRNLSHYSSLMEFIENNHMSSQIYNLGLIPRDVQLQVFRHSAAIIQPSLFEGWSTVVEDTRAIGRPIFLSDIPVHREQNLNSAYFFDPNSITSLASIIIEKWPQLSPGPDFNQENLSYQSTLNLIDKSSTNFISIVSEVYSSTLI